MNSHLLLEGRAEAVLPESSGGGFGPLD
jgi:hypothetical protein